jgi:hypothetical protein
MDNQNNKGQIKPSSGLENLSDRDLIASYISSVNNFKELHESGLEQAQKGALNKVMEYIQGDEYKKMLQREMKLMLAANSSTPLSDIERERKLVEQDEGLSDRQGGNLSKEDMVSSVLR